MLSRRRALRADLAGAETALVGAERARDRLLGALVEALAPAFEADERMRAVLEPLKRLDAVARERSAELASTDAQYAKATASLDTERAGIQQQVDAQRATVDLTGPSPATRRSVPPRRSSLQT